jgi:tetratricopeptide (TPR) repeat protein
LRGNEIIMTAQAMLGQAMAKHQAGDFDSAETLYEKILSQDPFDADALNLLGVLALQRGKVNHACDLIQRAIAASPRIAEYHYNLGQALKGKGDVDGAINCFRQSLALNPGLQIADEHLRGLIPDEAVHSSGKDFRHTELKRFEVVQQVIDRIKGQTYLEIGIDTGESFVNIRVGRKIGIDPIPTYNLINQSLSEFNIDYFKYATAGVDNSSELTLTARSAQSFGQLKPGETAECHYTTSDMFFEQKAAALFSAEKIDVAFVDGLHTYEQTYQDVLNVLSHLSTNGVILMHDCNPPTESSAYPAASWEAAAKMNLPGWDGRWCGDVWKAVIQLRATRDDLNIFVLDCDFGIGVVTKRKPDLMLDYSTDQIRSMTFSDLRHNRKQLLNLKSQAYLYQFLDTLR